MTIRDFGECIEFNIEHNIKHAILGLGAPGIGKSQIVQQIGDKHGFKVIDIRLSQMSEVEIGGLIYPNEDKTKTRWLTPEILPDEKRDGKNTILLLDELTSCSKRVQVAAYQLILDRRIGEYRLPEGTFIVALGNREEDDGVYVEMAGPLADRFEIHEIDIDFASWKNGFALTHDVHPYVIKYLSTRPSSLHTQSSSNGSMVFATPRSWERVSDILKYDSDVTSSVVKNKIEGNIGGAEAMHFIAFCQGQGGTITVADMIKGSVGPSVSEQAVVLIDGLIEKIRFIKRAHSFSGLKGEDQKTLQAVIKAFFRFPNNEFTILGIRKAMDINRDIVKQALLGMDSPEITAFFRNAQMAAKWSA